LSLTDWFTPSNQDTLNSGDIDLGAGGVMLLPDQSGPVQHLALNAGKEGKLYLLDRDNMGRFQIQNQVVQSFGLNKGSFSTPAFWQNRAYLGVHSTALRLFTFDPSTGQLNSTAASQSSHVFGFPGTTPSISSSGSSHGIVWAIDANKYGPPKTVPPGPAVLYAYDATNLATELWNSSQAANSRDQAGNAVKFAVPTIANGKVYVGTKSELDVYGLLN